MISGPATINLRPLLPLDPDGCLERLREVLDDVLGVLEADTDPDEVLRDPEGDPLLLLDGSVGH